MHLHLEWFYRIRYRITLNALLEWYKKYEEKYNKLKIMKWSYLRMSKIRILDWLIYVTLKNYAMSFSALLTFIIAYKTPKKTAINFTNMKTKCASAVKKKILISKWCRRHYQNHWHHQMVLGLNYMSHSSIHRINQTLVINDTRQLALKTHHISPKSEKNTPNPMTSLRTASPSYIYRYI